MAICVLPPALPQSQQGLLADQFRVVADVANVSKAEGRAADVKAWQQMLQQFVPVVIRECRQAAQDGVYQCTISLSALLQATQWTEVFPEQSILCWHCQGAVQPMSSNVRSVLRGCFFSTQPDMLLETPAGITFDVTDFVHVVSAIVVLEMELHGFSVKTKPKKFNVACAHLALFTPTKAAPDELNISWYQPEERQVAQPPRAPGAAPVGVSDASARDSAQGAPDTSGNIVMTCGVCQEDRSMRAILPCGHLICGRCWAGVSAEEKCPFCRGHAALVQPLFAP